ncbi:MmgE/PrpD family protein [Chloroflexota bacterium]
MPKFAVNGQEDPMSTLCRMVTGTKYEDFPSNVIEQAKLSILDTIAVTIGGSAMEGVAEVVDMVKAKGGKPESVIPFYGGKVPASEAGLAIGPMSRAMDFGDIHDQAGHCSEYVIPALLAAAGLRDKVTGKELITAYVVGSEVSIRVGMGWRINVSFPMGRGEGHATFGTVAAVGKLLGLSLGELENSQGIARAMTQPHDLAMFSPATLIARVHHGFICQDAINTCLLARRGITGPTREILSGFRGYFAMAKWDTDPDKTTRDLGETWEIPNLMRKNYSSCGAMHTSIDAMLELMKEHNFQAEDIASISIEASPPGWQITQPKEEKWNPKTAAECQFSIPYVVATTVYRRDIFLDSFTPEAMARREVRELMTRISVTEDKNLPNLAARVHTTLKDGSKYSKENIYIKGHPKNPMTEQDLINKFMKCVPYSAYKLSGEVTESLIKAILNLEEVDDVMGALIFPLTPK